MICVNRALDNKKKESLISDICILRFTWNFQVGRAERKALLAHLYVAVVARLAASIVVPALPPNAVTSGAYQSWLYVLTGLAPKVRTCNRNPVKKRTTECARKREAN